MVVDVSSTCVQDGGDGEMADDMVFPGNLVVCGESDNRTMIGPTPVVRSTYLSSTPHHVFAPLKRAISV